MSLKRKLQLITPLYYGIPFACMGFFLTAIWSMSPEEALRCIFTGILLLAPYVFVVGLRNNLKYDYEKELREKRRWGSEA